MSLLLLFGTVVIHTQGATVASSTYEAATATDSSTATGIATLNDTDLP